MHAVQCPTNNHFKIHFLSFLFKTWSTVRLSPFYSCTSFIYQITSFRVGYTHTHTHTTLKTMSKTGRRLGRELYHPTRPAGTLVRYPHHPIISLMGYDQVSKSSNRTTSGTDQGNNTVTRLIYSRPDLKVKNTYTHWKLARRPHSLKISIFSKSDP